MLAMLALEEHTVNIIDNCQRYASPVGIAYSIPPVVTGGMYSRWGIMLREIRGQVLVWIGIVGGALTIVNHWSNFITLGGQA
jgi:hypothetical protein